MSAKFDSEHMYTYIKGFATALGWNDVLNALTFARRAHAPQTRKSGEPYIVHPLTIACHAIAIGLIDETIVAAALLHDVVEDCSYTPSQIPVKNDEIKDAVRRLTHVKGIPLEIYYKGIEENAKATVVKLLDRCDNVSTMAGVFTDKKTMDYIAETENYVMPLYRTAKNYYPEYSNALFVIKYHILSVTDSLRAVLPENKKIIKTREETNIS